jgi:hypothetical protein
VKAAAWGEAADLEGPAWDEDIDVMRCAEVGWPADPS